MDDTSDITNRPPSPVSLPARLKAFFWERRDWPKWVDALILAAFVGLLFVVFRYRLFGTPDPRQHPAVGAVLPACALTPVYPDDAPPLDEESLRGKWTLLFFWGDWSDTAIDDLAKLNAKFDTLADSDRFRFVPIVCPLPNRETADVPRRIERLFRRRQISVPCYEDRDGMTRRALAAAGGMQEGTQVVLPSAVLIDPAGTICAVWSGSVPGQEDAVARTVAECLARE
ncbi:hypothetical protein JCM19992_00950 [Thermostilla marina]